MLIYIFMGMVSMCTVKYVKHREYRMQRPIKLWNIAYLSWFIIWMFVTVFRRVDYNIGGSDAIAYVQYFQDCLIKNLNTLYANHLDKGFQLLTKCVRIFTSNYHIYFALIYAIIIIAYVFFINELALTNICYESMILVFFIFLRGFSTIRTNLSVAFLLLAIVYLYKNDKEKMIFSLILCLNMHIASFLFIPFWGFYFLYKKKKLRLKQWIILYGMVLCGSKIAQQILIKATFLRGAYSSYAAKSLESSFWIKGWKIAFGQLTLMVLLVIFRKSIKMSVEKYSVVDKARYQMIYLLCVYDFLMIPVNFILGVWRGPEYFYIPRLIMWGVLIKAISRKLSDKSKIIFRLCMLFVFIMWMIFRIQRTYESSCLMPYLFDF